MPWEKILLSPPVLLLGLTKLGGTLNFYMMLTELPSYLKYMYGIDIIDVGLPFSSHFEGRYLFGRFDPFGFVRFANKLIHETTALQTQPSRYTDRN